MTYRIPMTTFKDKTVLITGGANGIGREIALQFVSLQTRVIVWDCDEIHGRDLSIGHDLIDFTPIDLANSIDIEAAFLQLKSTNTSINILINNVGISKFKPLIELSTNEWDEILNVNLRAAFICSREFAKQHAKGDYGRIINISSTRHLMSEPHGEAYAASTGGIVSLTHALAVSLSGTGVTVNCISPGWIHTGNPCELTPVDHSQHPAGRVGKPADVADMCLFLSKPESDFITGQNFYVDGGMTKKMIYD